MPLAAVPVAGPELVPALALVVVAALPAAGVGLEDRSDCRSLAKLESALPPLVEALDAVLPAVAVPEDDVEDEDDDQESRLERMLLIDMAGLPLR